MRHCKKCARPLKPRQVPVIQATGGSLVTTIHVCKSPICELYGRSQ